MRAIPRDLIENQTYRLNVLSEATRKAVARRIAMIEFDGIEDLRIKLIEALEPYFQNAVDLAATLSAEFYDEVREFSTGERLGAIPQAMRDPLATEGAIRAFVGELDAYGIDRVTRLIEDRVDYEIKKAAAESMFANALADPKEVRFARVPTGSETCNFCIMLASRGFVYRSRKSAGGGVLDHWHPHCDCRVVPGFEGSTEVGGYDPDALYRKWKDSGFKPKS